LALEASQVLLRLRSHSKKMGPEAPKPKRKNKILMLQPPNLQEFGRYFFRMTSQPQRNLISVPTMLMFVFVLNLMNSTAYFFTI
jgi:hypothetical protein